MIPTQLLEISDFLRIQNLKLVKQFEDGRINATLNEAEILREIELNFEINIPRSRAWFDFSLEINDIFYPVNIKVTDTKHADNLNCKLGIYYALTGLIPDFANEVSWLKFFEALKTNLGKNSDKDYYFLVINKLDSSDVFVNCLTSLNNLQPNGNNLPFQCKWDNNRIYQKKIFEEATNYILSTMGKSIKLRSEIYFQFKRFFPSYV